MLQEVSNMVKDVVIIIISATFVELLLPKSELKRYVRLVIGLLIILVMLTPFYSFVQLSADMSPEFILAQSRLEGKLAGVTGGEDIFAERVFYEYRKRIGAEIERQVIAVVGENFILTVEVELADEGNFNPEIRLVTLEVKSVQAVAGKSSIRPVVIEIGEHTDSDGMKLGEEENTKKEELENLIVSYFKLNKEQVQINFIE